MSVDVMIGFVDRTAELALFRRMLQGRIDKRILSIVLDGEQGKSYLLLRLAHECERLHPAIPCVLLNFDDRSIDIKLDFLGFARAVRRRLGDKLTPAICTCEEAMYRYGPIMSFHGGQGESDGVDFGRRSQFDDAHISRISGRDQYNFENINIHEAPRSDDRAKQMADMGRALLSDLSQLGDEYEHVVVLLDSFECAGPEICGWLDRWLFEPLHRQLPHVLLVVAGRPECSLFFDRPVLWGGLVHRMDHLSTFSADDIIAYFEQRKIVVSQNEIPVLLDLVEAGGPSVMGYLGNLLWRIRGDIR